MTCLLMIILLCYNEHLIVLMLNTHCIDILMGNLENAQNSNLNFHDLGSMDDLD